MKVFGSNAHGRRCHLRLSIGLVVGALSSANSVTSAALPVAGSLLNDPSQTGNDGIYDLVFYGRNVNASGVAVGTTQLTNGGTSLGLRAVRWDATGTNSVMLGRYGTNNAGYTTAITRAINSTGTTVGYAGQYNGNTSLGLRAVRWDAGATTPTELANLGTASNGFSLSQVQAINDVGTSVGFASKYVSSTAVGQRAVRWSAGGTAVTELAVINLSNTGSGSAGATWINAGGTVVGWSERFSGATDLGSRAVRWNAGSVAANELGNLGTNSSGYTTSQAVWINTTGAAVGYANRYSGNTDLGPRAVRWDAGSATAMELGNLGASSGGATSTQTYGINDAGVAVGQADKYVGGTYLGNRAVRWNAGATVASELGTMGLASDGSTSSVAYAINGAGLAVGTCFRFTDVDTPYPHATAWDLDGSPIDLNDLDVISTPAAAGATWELDSVTAIATDGWVTGQGYYDPDGDGPAYSVARGWVGQLGLGGAWVTTATTGVWGRGVNWSTGTPAIQRDALFTANAAYAVGFDKDERCRDLKASAGSATLQLAGHALVVDDAVTVSGTATLTLAGTGQVTAPAVTVSSGNATDLASLQVTSGGHATIPAGSQVSIGSNGGRGALNVSGAGSAFDMAGTAAAGSSAASSELDIGLGQVASVAADGSLTINNGAQAGGGGADVLIGNGGGHGTATVAGTGSTLAARFLAVGYGSPTDAAGRHVAIGTLEATDGAHVNVAADAFVGADGSGGNGTGAVSVGRPDGADAGGSLLQVGGKLVVGDNTLGLGTLRQRRGGAIVVGGNLQLSSGATLERNVSSPLANDGIRVAGNVTLHGKVTFTTVASQPTPTPGAHVDAVTLTGTGTTVTGGFDAVTGFDLGNGLRLGQSAASGAGRSASSSPTAATRT